MRGRDSAENDLVFMESYLGLRAGPDACPNPTVVTAITYIIQFYFHWPSLSAFHSF